jgi:hypothetical protein
MLANSKAQIYYDAACYKFSIQMHFYLKWMGSCDSSWKIKIKLFPYIYYFDFFLEDMLLIYEQQNK